MSQANSLRKSDVHRHIECIGCKACQVRASSGISCRPRPQHLPVLIRTPRCFGDTYTVVKFTEARRGDDIRPQMAFLQGYVQALLQAEMRTCMLRRSQQDPGRLCPL